MPKPKKRKAKPSAAIMRREVPTLVEAVEKVLLQGDLSPLTVEQRLQYYKSLCLSLGLNPLTKPFDYLQLSGKLVLYAKRDCTDQLRKIYGVSVTHLECRTEDGMCIAKVEVRDKGGRTDAASGAIWVEPLKALDLANAIMKAETKAKRRATLSICGMGMLDESELDTISDKRFVTDGGRIIHESGDNGSREAAQAVAARKIAEHRTKAENAIGNSETAPNPQMAQSLINKQESLTLTPYKGMLALAGAGLNIIRSEMTEDDRAFFGIKNDGGVYCLEEKLAFKFEDLCKRLNVTVTWVEAAKPVQPKERKNPTLPRAVIPPYVPAELATPSTDPILFEAKAIEPRGKKPFMKVKWNGGEHSCFDKGLWPILLMAIGKPTMLETKKKGEWSNLMRIVRVNGVDYAS